VAWTAETMMARLAEAKRTGEPVLVC
jgi:hypothetical protein